VADYDLTRFYDAREDKLTDLFYVADRSMRESGYDPSNRFGPFNIGVIDHNPVCLNVLLYVMEMQTADIVDRLSASTEPEVRKQLRRFPAATWWRDKATHRAALINRTMWDEEAGLYFDYNYVDGTRRGYAFSSTFFPLWAGIASREQAARVVRNLVLFEKRGGLQASAHTSGSQWDSPFGWAPLQLIAFKGLQRYGYELEANRIAVNFLSTVLKEYVNHNAIFEKYDVTTRESQVGGGLRFGYTSNEVGFGWTNGAFLELYAELPEEERARVRRLDGIGVGDMLY
jgi:alpha,alpha-trehalase